MQEWKMKAYLHAIYDSILKNSGLNPKGIAREVFFAPIRDPFFRFHDGSRFTGGDDSYERLGDLLGYSNEDMLVGTLSILSARFAAVVKTSVFQTCAPASRIYAVEEFLLSNSPEMDKLVYAFSGISITEMKKRVDTFFTCSPDDPGLNQADGYTLNLRFHQDNKSSYSMSCLAIASTPAVLATILDEAMLKAGSFYDARSPGKDYPVSATIEKNGVLILKTRVIPATVKAGNSNEPAVWDFARPVIDWDGCEWQIADSALLMMVLLLASKEAGLRYKNQCLSDALGL